MTWVDEGTGRTAGDGAAVECVGGGGGGGGGGGKANAMWRGSGFPDGVTEGAHYWALKVLAGDGLWFGLATAAGFGAGWKLRGAMYGCNTSDGGGLVHQRFGQPVKEGDSLGVYVHVVDDDHDDDSAAAAAVSVRFFHNGRPLGEAFRIAVPGARGTPPAAMFPVVSFPGGAAGGGRASIAKEPPPAELERAEPPSGPAPEGHYELRGCFAAADAGAPMRFPRAGAATLDVAWRGPGLQLSAKAGNTLTAVARKAEGGGGGWRGGPVMATRMLCEETAELEQFLASVLGEQMDRLEFSAGESLTLGSPAGAATFARCAPPAPEPCTKNVFS